MCVQSRALEKITVVCREIPWDSPAYHEALRLRNRLLRQPLGLSLFDEDLSGEIHNTHIGAFMKTDGEDRLVGILMLVPNPEPGLITVRQVAVEETLRLHGIGRQLMDFAAQTMRNRGDHTARLSARLNAADFYRKLGYQRCGDIYEEVGLPHYQMRLLL